MARQELGSAPSRPADNATKAYVDAAIASISAAVATGTIVGEVPTGTKDGVNDTFTLIHNFVGGSTSVFRNGLREMANVGYTESSPNAIVFSSPPLVTDVLSVDYAVQSGD